LAALALTFYNKNFIGGKADRGALQRAFQVSVAGLFFIVLVFWISPALSNYGIMNLFLFAELFAFGYWAAALGGQNIHAGAVMFFIIATVGLDAEKPVGSKLCLIHTSALCCRYLSLPLLGDSFGLYFRRLNYGDAS
jgi:hypothetical protein